jgi:hypothetical protein
VVAVEGGGGGGGGGLRWRWWSSLLSILPVKYY